MNSKLINIGLCTEGVCIQRPEVGQQAQKTTKGETVGKAFLREREIETYMKHMEHCRAQNRLFGKTCFVLCNALRCLQIDSLEAQTVNH
jgi:hypothetical protein